MKKRDIAALTVIYAFAALMFVFLAAFTARDCPVEPTRALYDACVARSDHRYHVALTLVAVGYPATLAWFIWQRRTR